MSSSLFKFQQTFDFEQVLLINVFTENSLLLNFYCIDWFIISMPSCTFLQVCSKY